MNESQKYCRSLHAPISLGTTSDDRFMPPGYLGAFARMSNGHVLTEKLDGENNLFSRHGLFARSHTAATVSPWTKPLRERWELIKNDLGDLEIFGEGMHGIHSIKYHNLESYYYVFGVRENERWLSWEEVKFYAALFDFPTVPEIKIKVPLKDFYKEGVDENKQLQEWFKINLGMSWEEYVLTPGALNGQDYDRKNDILGPIGCEGFVLRNADGFTTNGGEIKVAENEFNNLFKLVRAKHVKTDEHWTKNWKPASLVDYKKYSWFGYEYLSIKQEIQDKEKKVKEMSEKIFGYADIGRIVKYSGEYGVLLLLSNVRPLFEGEEDCVVIRWDVRNRTNSLEDYTGGNWMPEFVDEPHEFKFLS